MTDPEPRPPASSPCQAPPGYWGEDDAGAVLHGTWTVVAFEMDGQPFPNGVGNRVTFDGDTMTTVGPDWTATATFRADPRREPRAVDFVYHHTPRPLILRGVYRRAGETLVTCFPAITGQVLWGTRPTDRGYETPEATRPAEFRTWPGSRRTLTTFRRVPDQGVEQGMEGRSP